MFKYFCTFIVKQAEIEIIKKIEMFKYFCKFIVNQAGQNCKPSLFFSVSNGFYI